MFGIKYEPDWMVEDLKKNLDWVDDFAILDCRYRDELWIHEGEYRRLLREKAKELKADWVVVTSPDERWERNAGDIIRPVIDDNKDRNLILEVNLRELWTPTSFRWDGIWKNKTRRRIYPLNPGQVMSYKPIQCPCYPQDPNYTIKYLNVNIYHLKMIEPGNRKLRANVFSKLDPSNKYQSIGYDYLYDEEGIILKDIYPERGYYPPYKKYEFKVPKKYL